MKQFKSSDLKMLIGKRGYPSVSLYVPTHMAGDGVREDPIRLKNLLSVCRDRLESQWPHEKILEFLKSGFDLVHNGLFWSYQHRGLALFITPDFSQYYQFDITPEEKLHIGNNLYILPLIKLLSRDKVFYILLLSQSGNRLWKAAYDSINEVELMDVPKNIDEILQYDVVEEQREIHTFPAGKIAGSGALFHSQGNIADDAHHKKNVIRYLKEVARGVDKQLEGQTGPLVLAGVEYEKAMYAQCSSYRHIAKKSLSRNGGRLDINKLHREALDIIHPYFDKDAQDCLNRFQQLSGTGKISTDINTVAAAAYNGRIDTLFVNTARSVSGKFDLERQTAEIHKVEQPGDEDLLNLAAIYALEHNAVICPAAEDQLSPDKPLAAILRY